MTTTRAFATAVMLAAFALGAAGPAWADPQDPSRGTRQMSGRYTVITANSAGQSTTNEWYFTPCGDGCASVTSGGQPLGQAKLANGQWTMDSKSNMTCSDGTTVPSALSNHDTWDATTLMGTSHEVVIAQACGQPVGFSYDLNIQFKQAS